MSETGHQKTKCGHCDGGIEYPSSASGETISCPHCRMAVFLPYQASSGGNTIAERREAALIAGPNLQQLAKRTARSQPPQPNGKANMEREMAIGVLFGILVTLFLGFVCFLAVKFGWDWPSAVAAFFVYHFKNLGSWGIILPIGYVFIVVLATRKDAFMRGWMISMTIGAIIAVSCLAPLAPPDNATIDWGVNWALVNVNGIETTDPNQYVFISYRLSNQYRDTVASERHFVYDFTAQCSVVENFPVDAPRFQFIPKHPESRMVTFDGSVTLVKKGNSWYATKTVRVQQ